MQAREIGSESWQKTDWQCCQKRYEPEAKKNVVEDALGTTMKAASVSWGIPHRTVAYWYVRRGREGEEVVSRQVV